jgi:nitrogen fixation protein FixH
MFVLFLVLVGATVYRVITALSTHPGLVVEDAYQSGKRYGKTLEQKQNNIKQGWTLTLVLPKPIQHGIVQTYQAISKQNQKFVLGDKVAKATAYFYRPLEQKYDFSMPMALVNQVYQVQVNLPLKGRWDVLVEIKKDDFLQRKAAELFAQ